MGVIKAAEPGQQIYTFSLRFKLFLQQFLRFVLRLSEEKANLGDKVFRVLTLASTAWHRSDVSDDEPNLHIPQLSAQETRAIAMTTTTLILKTTVSGLTPPRSIAAFFSPSINCTGGGGNQRRAGGRGAGLHAGPPRADLLSG